MMELMWHTAGVLPDAFFGATAAACTWEIKGWKENKKVPRWQRPT